MDGMSWFGATDPNRYRVESIYYTNQPQRFVVNCGDDSPTSSGDMRSNLLQAERLAAVNAFASPICSSMKTTHFVSLPCKTHR
jgi:hypothetical protein